jgi:hypothetical protein
VLRSAQQRCKKQHRDAHAGTRSEQVKAGQALLSTVHNAKASSMITSCTSNSKGAFLASTARAYPRARGLEVEEP